MVRALFGFILGALLFAILAVGYGKMRDLSALAFQPILLVAVPVGAVLGAVAGFLKSRNTRIP